MASLEHLNKDGRDCFRIRFVLDKKRYRVALGNFDEADAQIAKDHIEHLIGQCKRNRPPAAKTSAWLDQLPNAIHDRLATLGLTDPRERCELPRTVLAYMRAYILSRSDWKKPENYRQAVDHLESFLQRDSPLTGLSKGDVERWQRWMIHDPNGPQLSANTAGQNVKRPPPNDASGNRRRAD